MPLKILLRYGAETETANDLGWTSLHLAAQHDHTEVMEVSSRSC